MVRREARDILKDLYSRTSKVDLAPPVRQREAHARRREGGGGEAHYNGSNLNRYNAFGVVKGEGGRPRTLSVATERPNQLQHSHIGSHDLVNNQANFVSCERASHWTTEQLQACSKESTVLLWMLF